MGEIRFLGTGETRGYPYPVCNKRLSALLGLLKFYFILVSDIQQNANR